MTPLQLQDLLDIQLTLCPADKPEDIIRHQYRNTYALNESGEIIGLNLLGNDLAEIKDGWLEQLPELRYLNVSENNLSAFTIPKTLSQLTLLNLSENESLTAVKFPEIKLNQLQQLHLHDCRIEKLLIPEGLTSLDWLDVARNKELKEITFQGDCPKLTYLDLSNNSLTKFSLPVGFAKLKYLYLVDNRVEELSIGSKMEALKTLHLRNNQLTDLPDNFLTLEGLEVVYLHGNPWTDALAKSLPSDKRDNGLEAARAYAIEAGKGMVLNDRVKIIIVGNGRVGKTSMLRRLRDEEFDENEPYTHGIQLGELTPENLTGLKEETLRATVWDFGGQEIFYATHQYFLSDNALYLLAWTSEENVKEHRKKEGVIRDESWRNEYYWINNIRHRGKGSPLLMIQTHCDKRETDYSAASFGLEKSDCVDFSAEDKRGLIPLRKKIVKKLNEEITVYGEKIPQTYENVITKVLEKKDTGSRYLSLQDFNELCSGIGGAGITAGNEVQVLEFLRRTGLVVHFANSVDEWLRKTIFIDPNWLTEQTYLLINDQLIDKEGVIDQEYLLDRLPESTYDEKQRQQLLQLLQNFELIFWDKDSESPQYISPQYLPEKLSRKLELAISKLRKSLGKKLWLSFPKYLPDNIMINFLARYGPYSDHLYWRHGISFDKEEVSFLVTQEVSQDGFLFQTEDTEAGISFFKEVLDSFLELSADSEIHVSLDGENWVDLPVLLSIPEKNEMVRCTKGNAIEVAPFLEFFAEKFGARMQKYSHSSIRELVAQDKLKEALARLKGVVSDSDLSLVRGRLTNLEKDSAKGIISVEAKSLKRNQIGASILSLLDEAID